MATKQDWGVVPHDERVKALGALSSAQLALQYTLKGLSDEDFIARLAKEKALWNPQHVDAFYKTGSAPSKDILIGAWRDLDRSEAILEMLDNSIDAWRVRRETYPNQTPAQLNVYIGVDTKLGQLTYEDNAGGVPEDRLANLVIPGASDTEPLARTIGSYKTGGKKALFRLASAVSITTRYLPTSGAAANSAFAVHLDDRWLRDPHTYAFPYASLKAPLPIDAGITRFVLQLRDEPFLMPWYKNPGDFDKLRGDIVRTYTLLLVRNPSIKLYFLDKNNELKPDERMYELSGTYVTKAVPGKKPDGGAQVVTDLRPQLVTCRLKLPYEGQEYDLEIELMLGCRIGIGETDSSGWGMDLYGNDRQFISRDPDILAEFMPKGAARMLLRGFINIRSPNFFIPWDTHKRHLNADRDIVRIIKSNVQIRSVVQGWADVFAAAAKSKRGELGNLLGRPMKPIFGNKDIAIPREHREDIGISRVPTPGESLPVGIFVPKVPGKPPKQSDALKVGFSLKREEARDVLGHFALGANTSEKVLSQHVYDDLMKRVGRHSRATPRSKAKPKPKAKRKGV